MEKNEELKKIPRKNYIVVAVIFTFTIALAFTLYVLYNNGNKEMNDIPVMRGVISELNEKSIDDYFLENSDFFIYVGVANDDNSRKVEENLESVLKKRNILDKTIYLNITSITDKNKFYTAFNDKYSNGVKLQSYPAFIIISNKKILDIVQSSNNKITIFDIERILDEYEVREK